MTEFTSVGMDYSDEVNSIVEWDKKESEEHDKFEHNAS